MIKNHDSAIPATIRDVAALYDRGRRLMAADVGARQARHAANNTARAICRLARLYAGDIVVRTSGTDCPSVYSIDHHEIGVHLWLVRDDRIEAECSLLSRGGLPDVCHGREYVRHPWRRADCILRETFCARAAAREQARLERLGAYAPAARADADVWRAVLGAETEGAGWLPRGDGWLETSHSYSLEHRYADDLTAAGWVRSERPSAMSVGSTLEHWARTD